MAGVEIIGVLASAGQLFHYSLAIINSLHAFYERAQRNPEQYQRQVDQLTELTHTVNLIKDTESLDTPLVLKLLQAILARIRSLDRILEQCLRDKQSRTKTRLWKAIWTARREGEIQKEFNSIEEVKSSLLLCVLGTYGKVLFPTIQRTATSVDRIEQTISSCTMSQSETHNLQMRQIGLEEEGIGETRNMQQSREPVLSDVSEEMAVSKPIASNCPQQSDPSSFSSSSISGPTAMTQMAVMMTSSPASGPDPRYETHPSTGMRSAVKPEEYPTTAITSGHSYINMTTENSVAIFGNVDSTGTNFGRANLYQGITCKTSKLIIGDSGKDFIPANFFDIPG
ncbi:hypothetical protein GQ44DRAFT_775971 [Phaeosphaeriaceae sp. PMI808]|nr:hypothetical protein GQ44DRAFT_775971 [Phaeosphaeriaceae sp. PMI808]